MPLLRCLLLALPPLAGVAALAVGPSTPPVSAPPAAARVVDAALVEPLAPASPRPCRPQPAPAPAVSAPAGSVGVVVVVGAVSVVRVDDAGRAVAARTTTEQAPCATDVFVDEAGAPLPRAARDAVLAAVVEHGLDAVDWVPGVWRPLG